LTWDLFGASGQGRPSGGYNYVYFPTREYKGTSSNSPESQARASTRPAHSGLRATILAAVGHPFCTGVDGLMLSYCAPVSAPVSLDANKLSFSFSYHSQKARRRGLLCGSVQVQPKARLTSPCQLLTGKASRGTCPSAVPCVQNAHAHLAAQAGGSSKLLGRPSCWMDDALICSLFPRGPSGRARCRRRVCHTGSAGAGANAVPCNDFQIGRHARRNLRYLPT
jgi:hypothetical protein